MRSFALVLVAALASGPAQGGVLIEGRLDGVPLRLEFATPSEGEAGFVRATVAGELRILEIAPEPTALARSAEPQPAQVQLEPLGGGAMIAGYGGTWQILFEDGRVCAEILAAAWMLPFLEPAVRAIELLQASDPRLRPRARHGCSRLGFRTWTSRGWPLSATAALASCSKTITCCRNARCWKMC